MRNSVKNIIIGFGKAGKTLAAYFGENDETTVLIEKSKKMYGGTCINVGCIPSKTLSLKSYRKKFNDLSNEDFYLKSMKEKKELISKLNKANYDKLDKLESVEIIDGLASFLDENSIQVETSDGVIEYEAERIFINTGAYPFLPPIEGLELSDRILTSEGLLDLEDLPERLTIIGGGFIGLEFAKMYAEYGSKVTVLDTSKEFMEKEDEDVASEIKKSMKHLGIEIISNSRAKKIQEEKNSSTIAYEKDGELKEISQDYVLISTGRRPNIKSLKLENAGIELGDRGNIKVNEFLQTNKEHIFAIGDVNGGPNFTYVSLDDYRVVKNFLNGNRDYSTKNRKFLPTSSFIYPTLSKVGLSEKEAREKDLDIKVFTLPVSKIPKAKMIGNEIGIYKAIVDKNTNKILGATLFAEKSHEVINIISTAMHSDFDYTDIRDQIFTHPTMAEGLNLLFG